MVVEHAAVDAKQWRGGSSWWRREDGKLDPARTNGLTLEARRPGKALAVRDEFGIGHVRWAVCGSGKRDAPNTGRGDWTTKMSDLGNSTEAAGPQPNGTAR